MRIGGIIQTNDYLRDLDVLQNLTSFIFNTTNAILHGGDGLDGLVNGGDDLSLVHVNLGRQLAKILMEVINCVSIVRAKCLQRGNSVTDGGKLAM